MIKKKKDFVKKLKDTLDQSKKQTGKKREKSCDLIHKQIEELKIALKGDDRSQPDEDTINITCRSIISEGVLESIVDNLESLSFEAKKHIVVIWSYLMHRDGCKNQMNEYMANNLPILDKLVLGYEKPAEIAKCCGSILRLSVEQEVLCKHLLSGQKYVKFYDYIEDPDFDLASDAFTTFKEMLTKHKALCATFLETNYDTVFGKYTTLLNSQNYVTKRQSLKLLGELLLDRANFNVMTRYISERDNLILMMKMLRDTSKNIQFEAFHVFKVFVANPNKADVILDILIRNKERLIAFLNGFHNEKAADDEQFADEKAFLLKQIEMLPNKV